MAPHSSTFAWKIPWTEEPGGLQFMGSLRVGHDWATSLSLFTFMHWRRKWQPTPVFLPRESQGREAWLAAVYGVAQSRTGLKRRSSSIAVKYYFVFNSSLGAWECVFSDHRKSKVTSRLLFAGCLDVKIILLCERIAIFRDLSEKTNAGRGLGAGGGGDDRGWDGWMASLTRWTWVSVNSRSWWWTGRPGVLRFMGSQRVGHDWVTDLIWSDVNM